MSISARNSGLLPLLILLAGCAVGPDFASPAAPQPDHYAPMSDPRAAGEQKFTAGADPRSEWWREFGSPKLDSLLAEALAANPGIEAARANLLRSQHALRAGYGIFFPSVGADADATRQRSSPARLDLGGAPSLFNLFTLSATVSYALDVFGGERRMIEGLQAQADLARADQQAAILSLEANIVEAVIAKAAYRAQIAETESLIADDSEQVRLAEARFQSGAAAFSAVLALKSQLAAVKATLPPLQQKASQAENLLAALAGRAPGEWTPPDIAMSDLTLPRDIPLSLPSELLRRRPDIVAANAVAHDASANIGVATAAMLPSITLSGSYGSNATSGGALFADRGIFWSMGAGLATPIFEGGSLWYRRKAAVDAYDQAAALYRQTVLAAFVQVADSLRALEHDADAVAAEDQAAAAAESSLALMKANYASGLASYLDLMAADGLYRQARIGALQAAALRYQDTVALFAALGGGWKDEAP